MNSPRNLPGGLRHHLPRPKEREREREGWWLNRARTGGETFREFGSLLLKRED